MLKVILQYVILPLIIFLWPSIFHAEDIKDVFYSVGKNQIEIRSIASKDSTSFIRIETKNGIAYKLEKSPIVSSSDLIGITLQKDFWTLYFKRTSWGKIKKRTSENLNNECAVIINNKIFYVAPLREPLTRALQIRVLSKDGIKINEYFKELSQRNPPDYLNDQEEYISFLEISLFENSDDSSIQSELAYLYMNDAHGKITSESMTADRCSLAIPLLERLLAKHPNEITHYNVLSECKMVKGDYEGAIKVIESSIPYITSPKWFTDIQLGTLHVLNGSYQKALDRFEDAKFTLQSVPIFPDGVDDFEVAMMFFGGVIENEDKNNIDTIESLENYLKKEVLEKLETLINEAKEGVRK
ncbi:MAG: hypothetical protein V6Z89_12500 [Desulfobacter sp.]